MRKWFLLLTVALILILCACQAADPDSSYTVTRNGVVFTVDTAQNTISDGANTYQYAVSLNGGRGYKFWVVYPDGSSFWWRDDNTGGAGGGSGGYDADRYVDAFILMDVVMKGPERDAPSKSLFPGLLLLAIGVFYTAAPRTAWFLDTGWHFKGAEPSDLALTLHRFGGVFIIILAVLVLIC